MSIEMFSCEWESAKRREMCIGPGEQFGGYPPGAQSQERPSPRNFC
jgi:hypothetical protein